MKSEPFADIYNAKQAIKDDSLLPKHIAIIMDGNGRWAKQRRLPRVAGHKVGVDAVRKVVTACVDTEIEILTLFTFSSENWSRPPDEVNFLMNLFATALEQEARKLDKQNIQLKVIGDKQRFDANLIASINYAEDTTRNNSGLKLIIAANYGGRWDIIEAARKLAQRVEQGELSANEITQSIFQRELTLVDLPEPDLFIRTGGEIRLSNFLIWQLAYSELYFTQTLWPDFDKEDLMLALTSFSHRQRRYGKLGESVSA